MTSNTSSLSLSMFLSFLSNLFLHFLSLSLFVILSDLLDIFSLSQSPSFFLSFFLSLSPSFFLSMYLSLLSCLYLTSFYIFFLFFPSVLLTCVAREPNMQSWFSCLTNSHPMGWASTKDLRHRVIKDMQKVQTFYKMDHQQSYSFLLVVSAINSILKQINLKITIYYPELGFKLNASQM